VQKQPLRIEIGSKITFGRKTIGDPKTWGRRNNSSFTSPKIHHWAWL